MINIKNYDKVFESFSAIEIIIIGDENLKNK